MNAADVHHLAAAYALDALDAEERRAYEAHYPSCEICRREVGEFRETAAVLTHGPAAEPRPELKAAIMAEIAMTRQVAPRVAERRSSTPGHWRGMRTVLVAAAAAVIAVVGTLVTLGGPDDVDEVAALLAEPDAVVSTLEGDGGSVRIVWSPERDEVGIVAMDLADPGDSRTYALWFIDDAGPAPAALFRPDDAGAVRTVRTVSDAAPTAWGVTIEPAGGSPRPTGDVLFSASV